MSIINNTLLLADEGGGPAYEIERSLRFRRSASAFLSRTLGSGNRSVWTWSAWVKRGAIGVATNLIGSGDGSNNGSGLSFASVSGQTDKLVFFDFVSGNFPTYVTTQQTFRDPSAWYHIVLSYDTTQATAANRVRMYVNGVQVTTFQTATYPSQNYASGFINSSTYQTRIGEEAGFGSHYDGQMTEINFVDGQALTPSSFGEFNALTGVWQPKRYAGTYGTNGFYLNFKDNASTSALGTDYSGRGNNWTTNNISLTAGATFDSMIDVPTPYDDGGNGRGNYAVLNPLRSANAPTSGNLNIAFPTASRQIGSTIALPSSGKWYFEATLTAFSGPAAQVGVSGLNYSTTQYPGAESDSYIYSSGGEKANNNSFVSYGASWTVNDVIGVAADVDAGTLVFYKNGVSQGTAYSGINLANTFFVVGMGGISINFVANFGQRPFAYTPPAGFKALNTQNLPEPTIVDGGKHFDALVWSGTGSNQQLPLDFTADFVWAKRRDGGDSHRLYDVIRGENQDLISNSTAAEATNDLGLDFIGHNYIEVEGAKYFGGGGGSTSFVAWNWKANGAGVTNTAGSITSTVSANPTAGFSIVTWTGDNNADSRVGHGLGVTPQIVIMKTRSDSSPWYFQTSIIDGSFDVLLLNTTNAKVDIGGAYTPPTSTTFTNYGPWGGTTLVAYCFAEVAGYSRFGRYTGNGSDDGPFVFCGFRPRFVMFKRSDSTSNWIMLDTSLNPSNNSSTYLQPNLSAAEGTDNVFDVLSNGFKLRNGGATSNASGGTYIFMAFAESPFRNALAR